MSATDLRIGSAVVVILPTGATRPAVIVSPSPLPGTWTVTVFLDRRYDGGEMFTQIENVSIDPWRPGVASIVLAPEKPKAPDQPTPYPTAPTPAAPPPAKHNGHAKPARRT